MVVAADVKSLPGNGGRRPDDVSGCPGVLECAVRIDGVDQAVVAADVDNAVGVDRGGGSANLVTETECPAGSARGGLDRMKQSVVTGKVYRSTVRAQRG